MLSSRRRERGGRDARAGRIIAAAGHGAHAGGALTVHELALCAGVVEVLEEQAREQHYRRVCTVRLEVGELAGVEVEALRFGFDVATRGTLAEGATLEIIELPGAAWCRRCARTVAAHRRFDPCPECGSHRLRVTSGTELRIKELEVE